MDGFFQPSGMQHPLLLVCFLIFPISGVLFAQERPSDTALAVDEAVRRALTSDARIESTILDLEASRSKVEEARRRQLPSLSLSANYTRLSAVDSSINLGALGTIGFSSPEDAYTLAANLQYPVFAGFRLKEAVRLAELQMQGKELTTEMTRNAVAFETRRAYWEAVRATMNVDMLRENLSLMERELESAKQKVAQGAALNADLLSARTRRDQAEMELGDAGDQKRRAFLSLGSLVFPGDDAAMAAVDRLILSSKPEDEAFAGTMAESLGEEDGEGALIQKAIASRIETRSAALAAQIAKENIKLAEAPLYPTLSVGGNYTYANPNSRVLFQSESEFVGTWNVGVTLSYDLGGAPANLAARDAQVSAAAKSGADLKRQEELVILDVRTCLISYERAKRDVDLVKRMLAQAQENERVVAERTKRGTANELDLLAASTSRLRSEFSIINKEIDLQIAAADLRRAVGVSEAK